MGWNYRIMGLAAAMTLAAGMAAAQTASDMAAGKTLYDTNCAVCHLSTGAGGMHFGDAVSADLRAPGLETTYHNNDTLIMRAILQAKDEDDESLDMPMPAWAGRLTTAQAMDIIGYLKTLHS